MKLGLSLALILGAVPCLAETSAGIAYLTDTSVEDRPLSLSIWYPSMAPVTATVGGNPVFEGVPAAPDAEVLDGVFPLVVVSHGGLRSAADSGAWFSSSIARAGYVVVEVNAPRPGNAAIALNEIWQRPQDIRRAIDLSLTHEVWGQRIDDSRISVAGFALGGTAALSLAGAELDAPRYMQSCADENEAQAPDCGWFAAQGVDLSQTTQDKLAGLTRDPRVVSAIAVNPEYRAALGPVPEEVGRLQISLGTPADTPKADQISQTVTIVAASVFDAFAVCTDAGPKILLEEEGDSSLCGVSAEAREDIHRKISETVISFLAGSAE